MSDHPTALQLGRMLNRPLPEAIATEFDGLQTELINKLHSITADQSGWFDWLGLGLTGDEKILLPSTRPRRGQDASYTWSGKYRERAVQLWQVILIEVEALGLPRLTADEIARWLLAQGPCCQRYVAQALDCSSEVVLTAVNDYLWHRYGRNMMSDQWLSKDEYDVYRELLATHAGYNHPPDTPRMWATLLWQRHRWLLAHPGQPITRCWLGTFFEEPITLALALSQAEHNLDNLMLAAMINETIWGVTPNNPLAYQLLQGWWSSAMVNGQPDWAPIQYRLVRAEVYHNRFIGWLALQGAVRRWLETLAEMPPKCTTDFMAWVLLQLRLTPEFDRLVNLPRRT